MIRIWQKDTEGHVADMPLRFRFFGSKALILQPKKLNFFKKLSFCTIPFFIKFLWEKYLLWLPGGLLLL